MNLPIRVFEIMAEIAEQNKVKPMKWARASGLSPSRISDFKRLAKKTKAGAAESDPQREVGGHIFSLRNFFTLWDGLKKLVDDIALKRGLIKQLEVRKALPTKVRIFMRLMAFNDDQMNLVDMYTDAVLQCQVNTSNNQNEG